jgi:hypothetical protein
VVHDPVSFLRAVRRNVVDAVPSVDETLRVQQAQSRLAAMAAAIHSRTVPGHADIFKLGHELVGGIIYRAYTWKITWMCDRRTAGGTSMSGTRRG